MRFRLQTKKIFITYKHVDGLNKELISNFLSHILVDLSWIIVSYESSDNDHSYEHYHVLISLNKKCDIKNQNYLDLSIGDIKLHGQYESVRNLQKAVLYVTKDGDYLASGIDVKAYFIKSASNNPYKSLVLSKIFGNQDIECYLNSLLYRYRLSDKSLTMKEIDLITDYMKNEKKYKILIRNSASIKVYNPLEVYMHISIYQRLINWVVNMNSRGILYKTLYLQGSPGTYKTTTLLTMLGENRVILMRHKDKAKYYRPEIHKVLIWDDVSFIHLPREYCINIVDSEQEYQHDVKGDMVLFCKEIIRVIISNKDPYSLSVLIFLI